MSPQNSAQNRPPSGANMDRVIARKSFFTQPWVKWVAIILVGIAFAAFFLANYNGQSFAIEGSRITVAPVVADQFEDYIPIRGRVTPLKTVFLDVIEGGQVQERLVEDGASVTAGQLLVTLNNTSLQLDVTRNEAMVTEQLNNMRTIELQLEQNRLQHKRALVEMDYQIQRLQRQVERLSNLDQAGVAAKSQLEDSQDELEYYRKRREVTLESQETDAKLQETQLKFLRQSAQQLEGNLRLARTNLDALNVRAPVSGKLSGFNIEVGQSIQRGGRLGQIDDPDDFKLRASVDEFYLSRVDIGLQVRYDRDDEYFLTVQKIYPQVQDGQFELDLHFDGEQPQDIKRGQTLQARLTLGDATEALIIPNGTFFQDTGGNWIFVLSDDASEAHRRNVRLGRRNTKYIEILDGLAVGERVITSAYSSFKEMDHLIIQED
ncbi:MAG: efflux RND transporter periplasmic adaptor subunit [Pseudomonadaceae bacterium]|nr:efflux RND transporter periplasmic adaptor subunit [Pseudomonadaceae bacterium]